MRSRSKDGRFAATRAAHARPDPWLGISEDVVRRFMDVLLIEHRYSLYTCAGYRTDLGNLDRWLQRFEGCTLVTADEEQLVRYLADWAGRRMSLRKLPRVLLSMRRFYSFLRDSHVREDDPMLHPGIARWYEKQRPRAETIRRQRESRQAAAERDRVMLALMIAGGLQAAQLITLRIGDLHMEESYLSVRGQPIARRVPLSPTLIEILHRFLLEPRQTLLRGRDSAHVFPSCGGRALTRREFWCAFRRRAEGFRALADRSSVSRRSRRWSSSRDLAQLSCHEGA